jgi:hypothetical protein
VTIRAVALCGLSAIVSVRTSRRISVDFPS